MNSYNERNLVYIECHMDGKLVRHTYKGWEKITGKNFAAIRQLNRRVLNGEVYYTNRQIVGLDPIKKAPPRAFNGRKNPTNKEREDFLIAERAKFLRRRLCW